MVGTTVLHYEILELLGSGAMGTVYKARDTKLDTLRALKFIQPGLSNNPEARRRLIQEAHTQSKLIHQNIAALLELEISGDQIFLVMEYVEGVTLDEYLEIEKPPLKDRLNLILQIAHAVEGAHSKGILHRDIKPKNILIASDGAVKITDFGLAKALGETTISITGGTQGTAGYMAPEMYRGETTSKESDVWSLGVLIYEVLEGHPPYQGETFEAIGYQVLNEPYPPLSEEVEDILPGISRVIDECLQKDRKERFSSGKDVLSSLIQVATDSQVSFTLPPPALPRKYARQRRQTLLRTAVLLFVGGAILSLWLLNLFSPQLQYEEMNSWPNQSEWQSASWDKSGDRIALIIDSGGPVPHIWENPTNTGTRPRRLEQLTQHGFKRVRWSSNDSLLALTDAQRHLYLYNPLAQDDISPSQISESAIPEFSWSEDGRWIVCRVSEVDYREGASLHRIGPIGSDPASWHDISQERLEITGLEAYGEGLRFYDPIYILGDTYIAFQVQRYGGNLGVWIVPVGGGGAIPILDEDLVAAYLNWDTRERALVFYSQRYKGIFKQKVKRNGRIRGKLQSIDIEGVRNIGEFDYCSDSGKIVLTTGSRAQYIWRIPYSADSDSSYRLNTTFNDNTTPMLSSDGRELFYSTVTADFGSRLRVYNFETNRDDYLFQKDPTISNAYMPAPDPSGRNIVFSAISLEGSQYLWNYDRVDSTYTKNSDSLQNALYGSWSADGNFLYYVPLSPGISNQDKEIRRIPVTRSGRRIWSFGNSERVVDHPSAVFTNPLPGPNGRYLLYEQISDAGINCIKAHDSVTGRITVLTEGQMASLSPSRKDLYFLRGFTLYVIRNWPDVIAQQDSGGEPLLTLPDGKTPRFLRPLAAGDDAVYIALDEQDVGQIKVYAPVK